MTRGEGKVTRTIELVREAKSGDRDAWRELVEQYYELWLGKYHGKLGAAVRKLYDTQDLVQSAVGDALRDLPDLRNEGVFFAWVTSIIRHKLSKVHHRLKREKPWKKDSDGASWEPADPRSLTAQAQASELEDYSRTLDAIAELFPQHPSEMAAVYLKFLEGCQVGDLIERLGRPRRTVYRWLRDGMRRLQERLAP